MSITTTEPEIYTDTSELFTDYQSTAENSTQKIADNSSKEPITLTTEIDISVYTFTTAATVDFDYTESVGSVTEYQTDSSVPEDATESFTTVGSSTETTNDNFNTDFFQTAYSFSTEIA